MEFEFRNYAPRVRRTCQASLLCVGMLQEAADTGEYWPLGVSSRGLESLLALEGRHSLLTRLTPELRERRQIRDVDLYLKKYGTSSQPGKSM